MVSPTLSPLLGVSSKGAEFSMVENGAFGSSSVVFAGEQLALDCSEEKRHYSEFASILPE